MATISWFEQPDRVEAIAGIEELCAVSRTVFDLHVPATVSLGDFDPVGDFFCVRKVNLSEHEDERRHNAPTGSDDNDQKPEA